MLVTVNKIVILDLMFLDRSLLMIDDVMYSLNEVTLTLTFEIFLVALASFIMMCD